jgi:hypothetical protein
MRRDRSHVSTEIIGTARGGLRRAWRSAVQLAAAAALVAPLVSCTSGQTAGVSPAYLIIDQLGGASGAEPDTFTGTLASDVLTNGGIFEDPGRVIFRLGLKDPGTTDSPTEPSSTNFITVTRYRVRYLRTDGRSTAGVDVPQPFEGGMTATVTGGGATATLTLVRIQAKLEAPLAALALHGGELAISTIAEITFYGKDQAGREVSVVGNISVNFADWADPEEN